MYIVLCVLCGSIGPDVRQYTGRGVGLHAIWRGTWVTAICICTYSTASLERSPCSTNHAPRSVQQMPPKFSPLPYDSHGVFMLCQLCQLLAGIVARVHAALRARLAVRSRGTSSMLLRSGKKAFCMIEGPEKSGKE